MPLANQQPYIFFLDLSLYLCKASIWTRNNCFSYSLIPSFIYFFICLFFVIVYLLFKKFYMLGTCLNKSWNRYVSGSQSTFSIVEKCYILRKLQEKVKVMKKVNSTTIVLRRKQRSRLPGSYSSSTMLWKVVKVSGISVAFFIKQKF